MQFNPSQGVFFPAYRGRHPQSAEAIFVGFLFHSKYWDFFSGFPKALVKRISRIHLFNIIVIIFQVQAFVSNPLGTTAYFKERGRIAWYFLPISEKGGRTCRYFLIMKYKK
ncbi:hypothetical protein AZE41_17355 [Sporosarcina psychrophila]|nr:hypothetical protein AZE41_17355 [Sporosarcina psychrophila]